MNQMTLAQRVNATVRKWPAWPIYVLGPLPGLWTFWLAVNNQLGPDPLRVLEADLGETALQLIILTLLITPVRRLTKISLLKFRRAFGVMSFVYVLAHLLTWFVLDQQLDGRAIVTEIIKRPYITIGMAGFLFMLPLAITSNNLSVRRMGAAAWSRLHRLAYLAALAGAIHYLLIVKAWPTEPIVYALVVVVLLLLRLWWRHERQQARKTRQA